MVSKAFNPNRFEELSLRIADAPEPRQPVETVEDATRRAEKRVAAWKLMRECEWKMFIKVRGERYRDCDFANFDCPTEAHTIALDAAMKHSFGYPWPNMIFFGPKGTGKDHLLAASIRAAIYLSEDPKEHITSAVWTTGADLCAAVRDSIGTGESENELVQRFVTPDILAISDPVPTKRDAITSHQADSLYRIIDRRYSSRLPIWITVNVANREELSEKLGDVISDRLIHDAVAISCNWESYRQPKP